ncbi:MAG: hypothetical protein QGG42_07090 [Phycisphaerae bacterium]|nr:hypothetical protein [Phycisphaerae bacterium]
MPGAKTLHVTHNNFFHLLSRHRFNRYGSLFSRKFAKMTCGTIVKSIAHWASRHKAPEKASLVLN